MAVIAEIMAAAGTTGIGHPEGISVTGLRLASIAKRRAILLRSAPNVSNFIISARRERNDYQRREDRGGDRYERGDRRERGYDNYDRKGRDFDKRRERKERRRSSSSSYSERKRERSRKKRRSDSR